MSEFTGTDLASHLFFETIDKSLWYENLKTYLTVQSDNDIDGVISNPSFLSYLSGDNSNGTNIVRTYCI